MRRSLIVAPQWIGDAVMTEPLVRRLHARGERITVGALPWVAPVYRSMPQVEQVIEFPFAHGGLQWTQRRTLARQLRGQFDVAYVCPNSLKSALLPFWAHIPERVGYLGESRYLLLNRRIPNPSKLARPPMVAFYSALSGESDVQADRPQLSIAADRVDAALAPWGLLRGGYYVFAPGAEYGPAKRWPEDHFAALAGVLPLPVVLLGSSKDTPLAQHIVQRVNGAHPPPSGAYPRCVDLTGRTSLDDALAIIAGARAVVTNDSGLMHVAAALDVPQVALFGSSSPLHTPPLSDRARVLWLKSDSSYNPPLDCAPCFERVCPLGHTRCLNDIAPGTVAHYLLSEANARTDS
jgi:heptosyltransferase-2